jgi:hypothetical protein
MIADERVLCRNPDPTKSGTRIPRWKYELIRDAIVSALSTRPKGFPFRDLPTQVQKRLTHDDARAVGSISWHTTVVKLDLEARGTIERIREARPQLLRLAADGR